MDADFTSPIEEQVAEEAATIAAEEQLPQGDENSTDPPPPDPKQLSEFVQALSQRHAAIRNLFAGLLMSRRLYAYGYQLGLDQLVKIREHEPFPEGIEPHHVTAFLAESVANAANMPYDTDELIAPMIQLIDNLQSDRNRAEARKELSSITSEEARKASGVPVQTLLDGRREPGDQSFCRRGEVYVCIGEGDPTARFMARIVAKSRSSLIIETHQTPYVVFFSTDAGSRHRRSSWEHSAEMKQELWEGEATNRQRLLHLFSQRLRTPRPVDLVVIDDLSLLIPTKQCPTRMARAVEALRLLRAVARERSFAVVAGLPVIVGSTWHEEKAIHRLQQYSVFNEIVSVSPSHVRLQGHAPRGYMVALDTSPNQSIESVFSGEKSDVS